MDFEIINGNCLDVLKRFPLGHFDACVADPPYCSGGVTPSSIGRGGANKYVHRTDLGNFADGMTQRAFYRFTVEWLSLVRKRLASPGYCFVFIDWRQLPVVSDAFQAAEFYWRGVAVWNKGNVRPNPGQISQTAEFIAWGTADAYKSAKVVSKGVINCPAPPPTKESTRPRKRSKSSSVSSTSYQIPRRASSTRFAVPHRRESRLFVAVSPTSALMRAPDIATPPEGGFRRR